MAAKNNKKWKVSKSQKNSSETNFLNPEDISQNVWTTKIFLFGWTVQ